MATQSYFIEGRRLFLRELRKEDVNDRYHSWLNDPETTQFLEIRMFPLSREEILRDVAEMDGKQDILFLAVCKKDDGSHIGNIKLGPINQIHRFADIGILIGDKACWGNGYATEAIGILSDFAFHSLNLNRLSAGMYEGNIGSFKAFENAGFKQEGILRKMRFYQGGYVDQVVMGMVRDEFIKT